MKRKSRILTALAIVGFLSSIGISEANDSMLTPQQELGKALFFEKISSPDSMSCAECHAPSTGFTGPIPGINKSGSVYRGAVPQRFGNRKPPSAAYATLSPIFHYDSSEGVFAGGNFFDGRATGERLGNPAADQALGPFLNPVEQNNPGKPAVLKQIAANKKLAALWEAVWGEPVGYQTPAEIEANYDRVGLSIAAYEASPQVNAFSSKFDAYLRGEAQLTELEAWGLELFNGKAMCAACHPSEGTEGQPPLFTDFTYDNLGVPKNPENPFYQMDSVFLDDGSPINPSGADWIDPGLGGFLATRPEWADKAEQNRGKHKVPTLRNVDKRPGEGFTKAYMHNGVFKSLKEVVHFYNTRDLFDWPPAEVPENVNTDELGHLGLTNQEEDAIVAFMQTLTDGWAIQSAPGLRYITSPAESQMPLSNRVVSPIPQKTVLLNNYPNPFNPETWFPYELAKDALVTLTIYNATGQLIRTIDVGHQLAGRYTSKDKAIYWNGRNDSEEPVASGVYFYNLMANDFMATGKLLIVK